MPGAWLALPSFAKINLSLELLGPRSDGFTEIRTVLQTVTLHDRLRLRPCHRAGIDLRVPHGGAPAGARNLVHKALRRTARLLGWRRGIEVELHKIIPTGRGLGGGSSNAAAAIIGLLRLAAETPEPAELGRLASALGSDVPFFLTGGTALAVARGDEVYPLRDQPRRWCLLFSPPFEVETRRAYRWARSPRLTLGRRPANISGLSPLRGLHGAAGNDFDPVVFPRFPRLGRWRSAMLRAGAEWCALAGSGSTLAGLFARKRDASFAAKMLAREGTVFLAETLSGAGYRRALGWKSDPRD